MANVDSSNRQKYETGTVLVVYGGPDEQHELAISQTATNTSDIKASSNVLVNSTETSVIVNWLTSSTTQYVSVGDLTVYIVGRWSHLVAGGKITH